MRTTPLEAAIKRVRCDAHSADVGLILRALDLLNVTASHIDSRNMMPTFEITPECIWKHGDKGLIHCVGRALVNEDAPEGAMFQ